MNQELIEVGTLLNIRQLRVWVRESGITLNDLDLIVEKLTTVRDEAKDAFEAQERERQERQLKLEHYRKMLLEDGIDLSDLLSMPITTGTGKVKSQRAQRPAKYQYLNDGVVKTWTGQGRMPLPIAHAIETEGKSLDDFLISAQV